MTLSDHVWRKLRVQTEASLTRQQGWQIERARAVPVLGFESIRVVWRRNQAQQVSPTAQPGRSRWPTFSENGANPDLSFGCWRIL
jgi:hypothetical protein